MAIYANLKDGLGSQVPLRQPYVRAGYLFERPEKE
jgi:hypothetical protein